MGKDYRAKRFKGKNHEGNTRKEKSTAVPSDSELCKAFELYRSELDYKYDKYERLVKVSRDLTIASKRVIFQLHRVSNLADENEASTEVKAKLQECDELIGKIRDEISSEDFNRYHRAFSPGLQEFVEAVTFLKFKTEGNVMPYEDVCATYITRGQDTEMNSAILFMTPMDYILGIGDLTGELMRMCINSIGAGEHEKAYKLCNTLRSVYDSLIVFHVPGGEFGRKLSTMRVSLKKVENACYQIHVRGKEVPKHMLMDLALRSNDDGEEEF